MIDQHNFKGLYHTNVRKIIYNNPANKNTVQQIAGQQVARVCGGATRRRMRAGVRQIVTFHLNQRINASFAAGFSDVVMRLGIDVETLRGALEEVERTEVEGLRGTACEGINVAVLLLEGKAAGAAKQTVVRRADTSEAAEAFGAVVLAERTTGEHTVALQDGPAILV